MKYSGYSVVEVLLATAIFVTVSIGVVATINSAQRVERATTRRDQARELLVEAEQALRYLQQHDFQQIEDRVGENELNVVQNNGKWVLEEASYTEEDDFFRFISVEDISDEEDVKRAAIKIEYSLPGSEDKASVNGEQYLLNLAEGGQSQVTRESANYQISNDHLGVPEGKMQQDNNN